MFFLSILEKRCHVMPEKADENNEMKDSPYYFEANSWVRLPDFFTICGFGNRGIAKGFEKGLVFLN